MIIMIQFGQIDFTRCCVVCEEFSSWARGLESHVCQKACLGADALNGDRIPFRSQVSLAASHSLCQVKIR